MSCLGVLFAITNADVKRLLAARQAAEPNEEVMAIMEEIEERWDEEWLHETDKAWDAIHRSLTDGQLTDDSGEYPLNHCILGGTQLYDGDGYILSLKSPEQVAAVAASLKPIDQASLRGSYFKMDGASYDGEMGEEDFDYTWDWFQGLPKFYDKAAKAKRSVLFTVDQ
jgi:hypothetical protein